MLRVAKWLFASTVGSATGAVILDASDYINLTNYSLIRAIRTGITTADIILDYKWSLHNLKGDSLEYLKAKSQVCVRYILLNFSKASSCM